MMKIGKTAFEKKKKNVYYERSIRANEEKIAKYPRVAREYAARGKRHKSINIMPALELGHKHPHRTHYYYASEYLALVTILGIATCHKAIKE